MNALEYLFGLEYHGHKFGLDNIRAITDALGRPQDTFRVLHVAGTNGKGSVCAMADAALRAAGHRTGCYTSPHLVRIEERFVVDGRALPPADVEAAIEHVRQVAARLQDEGRLQALPTFFEVATATAFELFRDARIEVAVVEVGLGGRLDATNITTPDVGVITNIDLEHQQYLGDTIAAIAAEKAGIIKRGMTVVTGERKPEALAVMTAACEDRGATLLEVTDVETRDISLTDGRTRVDFRTPVRTYGPCTLALRGRHQVDNAALAIRALEALDAAGVAVPAAAIVTGLESAYWPGRLDLIELEDHRRVLLDAAHNPAGARTFARYMAEVHPAGLPLVIGAVRDKDHRAMFDEILRHASAVVLTEPPTPRAAPSAGLATLARDVLAAHGLAGPPVVDEPRLSAAIDRAFASGSTIGIVGSIFLVGAVLERLAPQLPLSRRKW
jgi:dihydrofolate synthase / folylpolyglutamate synthase